MTDTLKRFYKTSEVANMLLVSPITVRKWAAKGVLRAETTLGGHRRFLHTDVVRFANENGLSLQINRDDEIRVLIVDDAELSEYFVDLFSTLPIDVVTAVANNGFVAGSLVHSFRPTIVLLDLMMPSVDGFQVCRTIKQDPTARSTRIIAMTSYYTQQVSEQILAEGAEVCLRKPFDKQELLRVLDLKTGISKSSSAG